ncbi:MAG: hypothetical protein K6F24_04580 [Atopobiaceae bacterium]|nr:hypothetical protein [Atopobiaceae bacterium]
MNGLNLRQEAALAIAWIHQDEGTANFTDLGLSDAFVSLKSLEMIKLTTDMSGELAFFQGMEVDGLNHYDEARKARRWFEAVSDHADALLLILAVQDTEKRATSDAIPTVSGDLGPVFLYQELSRHDLLNVVWADNSPYIVQVTDKGRNYAEGWFQDQMNNRAQNITIAPTFNNNGAAIASATIKDVTLSQTIGTIVDLNIDEQVKDEVQEAVRQLDRAAKNKDNIAFGEKLESIAKIIKSSGEIAAAVLPFVTVAIKTLLR